jgi:hypothetical protein
MKGTLHDSIMNLKYYAKFLRTGVVKDAIKAVYGPDEALGPIGPIKEPQISDFSPDEQEKARRTCKEQNQGKIAYLRWKRSLKIYEGKLAFTIFYRERQEIPKDLFDAVVETLAERIKYYDKHRPNSKKQWKENPTANNCKRAFIDYYREKREIPKDLFDSVVKELDKRIENYETNHHTIGTFNETFKLKEWQYSILKPAISKRPPGTTKISIFIKYEKKWGIPGENEPDPGKLLADRFYTRKNREIEELEKLISDDSNFGFSTREKDEIKEKITKLKEI